MINKTSDMVLPVLYLPHGGGPLPLLGDKKHEKLVFFLKQIVSSLGEPSAIIVIRN
jgi:hypothetical protein